MAKNTRTEWTYGDIITATETLAMKWEEGQCIEDGHIIPHAIAHFENRLVDGMKSMGVNYIKQFEHIKI